jgi:hypothetical protein
MLLKTFFTIVTLIIFGIPGFFLLWSYGFKAKNEFTLFLYSILWGTILMLIFYYALPLNGLPVLIRNPYVGSLIVSLLAFVIGKIAKKFGPRLKSWWILRKRI